jgi:hypothetical protein
MRRAGWAVAVLALAGCGPTLGRVVVEPPIQDFGVVEQGVRVTRGFVLRNDSRQALRIDRLVPACACTVAAMEGQTIGRGGQTVVSVTLDTTDLVGPTTKSIGVQTSDPRVPLVQLWLRGLVLADFMVAPSTVYLGHVFPNDPARRELLISPGRPGGTRYAAASVETESPALRTWIEPGPKPGQQKVVIEVTSEAPPGRFNDEVVIRTTSPRQPVIKVPVFGQIL